MLHKRSASMASLPTPPRTRHKRSRSRAPHNDSDGEDHSPPRKKRRKLGVHNKDDDDEDAFWTGRSRGEKQKKVAPGDKTEERSPSPAILSRRVKAPVSPPPSRRAPLIQPARASSVERDAPVTPRLLRVRASPSTPAADVLTSPTKCKATKIWPKRDSPNNPFLSQSSELLLKWDSSDDEKDITRAREGTPPTHKEKPTITYVFRGQKATFHNPLYGLAPEIVAASKLPMDHPDYEPAEACPPRRLFTSARKRKSSHKSASTRGVKRAKVDVQHSNDVDEQHH